MAITLLNLGFFFRPPLQADTLDRAFDRIQSLTPKKLNDVPVRSQSRDKFRQFLIDQLNESFTSKQLTGLSSAFSLLGALPDTYALKPKLIELYRNQAAAYYDPSANVIRKVEGNFPESALYFIYLHELVHAYQDQHYDLSRKQQTLSQESYDAKMAYTFVLEGHANLIATLALIGQQHVDTAYFRNRNHRGVFELLAGFTTLAPTQLRLMEDLNRSTSVMSRQLQQLQNVPDALLHMMLDPYLVGQSLWYEHIARVGWKDSTSWLKNPPETTQALFYNRHFSQEITSASFSDTTIPFETSAGVYALLRWTRTLEERPDWGAQLIGDRLRVLRTDSDTVLQWTLKFKDRKAVGSFASKLTGKAGHETQRAKPILFTVRRYAGKRYGKMFFNGSTVQLFLEDDSNRAQYLSFFPRSNAD